MLPIVGSPHGDEVARVQAETGMDYLQALAHVRQRAALISRHRSMQVAAAAACARRWAAQQPAAQRAEQVRA